MDGETDVVIIGSGVAGLTAALTARLEGLSCVVLEHCATFGGTSARSSGTVWIPDNPYLRERGITGDRAEAERYLCALAGTRTEPLWQRFLDAGPTMVSDLERRTGIGFSPYMHAADYRQDCPGAASGGRALEPLPFDGRRLGGEFGRLALPLRELMVFGGMMVTRAEAAKLLTAWKNPAAAWLGLRLTARYFADRLTHPRGTRLVMGNALVARLAEAVLARDGVIVTDAEVETLETEGGRVSGVVFRNEGRRQSITARRGVVLAGGGFPASPQLRERHLPRPTPRHTPAAPGCDGSSIALGQGAGAALGEDGIDNALWFPSSVAQRRDATVAVYPHIVLDRAKPGSIIVNAAGRRFANEAVSYHAFVREMYARNAEEASTVPCWLICDRRFIWRYGLGIIRPMTPYIEPYVRSGYVRKSRTLAGLAEEIGVPPAALAQTVERFNAFARTGVDEDFGRGQSSYDRSNGDPAIGPNPCLGPVGGHGALYAVALWPTPLGTSLGLRANADAQVLDGDGGVIAGLYACGNDMQSAFAGEYPGAGGQLGQAMTFGWLAARHMAGRAFSAE